MEVCVSLSSLLVQQLWEGKALWERSRGCFAGAAQESFLDVCGVLGLSQFSTLLKVRLLPSSPETRVLLGRSLITWAQPDNREQSNARRQGNGPRRGK